eukprot:1152453-Pelagomonas_calceolata.AAC.5
MESHWGGARAWQYPGEKAWEPRSHTDTHTHAASQPASHTTREHAHTRLHTCMHLCIWHTARTWHAC